MRMYTKCIHASVNGEIFLYKEQTIEKLKPETKVVRSSNAQALDVITDDCWRHLKSLLASFVRFIQSAISIHELNLL